MANFEDEKIYKGYKFHKSGCWYKSNNVEEKAYLSFYNDNENLVSVYISKRLNMVDVWNNYDNYYNISNDPIVWLNDLLYGKENN
jgi:hypothetical protein